MEHQRGHVKLSAGMTGKTLVLYFVSSVARGKKWPLQSLVLFFSSKLSAKALSVL